MITIRSLNELERHGISVLTGEACGYGYRILCDLNRQGIQLVSDALGINPDKFRDTLPPNWNSRVNRTEAVASIMLAPEMMTPLAVFACWAAKCSEVHVLYDGSVVGIEPSDDEKSVEMWRGWCQGKYCESCRRYGAGGGINRSYHNPGFARHQHAMSGRTV